MEEIKKSGKTESENFNDDETDEILPAAMTYLTPALIEKAKTELNETDETKGKALAKLRKLIEAEKNLVSRTDEIFLIPFLRARKFDAKRAFTVVQNYFKYLKDNRRIFDIRVPHHVTDILERDYLGHLEYRDRNGCLVLIFKVGKWDPVIDHIDDVMRAFSNFLAYTLEHEATQIAGYRVIFDIRGISFKHIKQLTPKNLLILIRGTQYCFPARYKGIHILSENRTIHFLWALMYPLLTTKLRKRIHFHGEDLSPLLDHVHPSVLPEEFGGRAPYFSNDRMKDVIHDRTRKVMADLVFGYKN